MNDATLLETMTNAIIEGDDDACRRAAEDAMARGIDPNEVISEGLMKGIEEVGSRFDSGEFFLPELLAGARAMQAAIDVVSPIITARGGHREVRGKVVLGTVQGDVHSIGKQIMASVFIAYGYEVTDLGVDVSVDRFVAAVQELNPDLLGASALMTPTMSNQKAMIDGLVKVGLRDKVKVMVGGAVCSPAWAVEIGADGYAQDAWRAVELAERLMGR